MVILAFRRQGQNKRIEKKFLLARKYYYLTGFYFGVVGGRYGTCDGSNGASHVTRKRPKQRQ